MAVPSSGAISLAGIKNEVNEDDYNAGVSYTGISLEELATGLINLNSVSKPNNIVPHGMSEWYGYDQDAEAAFSDDYGVSKSITTGGGQAVRIADSNGHFKFTDDDAFSYSFWVKPGWNLSLNTRIDLFSMSDTGASNSNSNTWRMWFYEPHNRIWIEWRDSSGNRKQNFWLFHSQASPYLAAYNAAGLGSTFWNSGNTGNSDSNGYALITFTKGASNSAANSNINLYWNGTSCGNGFYANGGGSGTPNLTNTNDKNVSLGSTSWNGFSKSGNNTETQFNDLSLWNKKLSATEVAEIYNNGTKIDLTTHSAASNLKGYYKFENNGNDSSGNGAPAFTVSGNSNYVST